MTHDTSPTFKIAVISDLHAFDSKSWTGSTSPSYFDSSLTGDISQCPVRSLESFIKAQHGAISADVLICPGDLSDKACAHSLPVAWACTHNIAQALGTSAVIATTGNHDVDSRGVHNPYDPIEALKKLSPRFPIDNHELTRVYWAEHHFAYVTELARVIVVNSSAHHTNAVEVEHGRVSSLTLDYLKDAIANTPRRDINVLLCHHNPHKHSELELGEHDEIRGGQQLLDVFGALKHGDWIVIHGHKHHPKISYAAGGSASPIVFSAGSVASTLYPELRDETGNQFYVLEFNPAIIKNAGLVGTFSSWDWHQGFGWRQAESRKGLPGKGGFGNRANPRVVAAMIHKRLSTEPDPYMRGQDLYTAFPDLQFICPADLVALSAALEELGTMVTFTDIGQIDEVAIA